MTQPNPCASWKRSLAIVWIGEFFSVLTSSILQMGLIWHVTLTTGSASALSFVSLAAFLPMALLGAFAGTIVDRTSIKRLMIGADLFIAAVSLTLVFGSLRGDLSVAVVAAVLFVRALGSTLHTPAFNALTPLIAPPEVLGKLAGMLQFMQSGSYIIGNAIAAVVYPAFGLTFMIALDVAGAVLASIAVATSGIKTPAPERRGVAPRGAGLPIGDGQRVPRAQTPSRSVRHALDRLRLLGPVLAHIRAVPAHGVRPFWGYHYAVGYRGDRVLGRHDRGERLDRGDGWP